MSHEIARPSIKRAKRSGVELEEEKAWVDFYRRVGNDPTLATEVLHQLESDPVMKRMHLALVLCCKDSLRSHKARQVRNKRIGQFVRWLCHGLFIKPFLSTRQGLKSGSAIAVECLPEIHKEPALRQMHQLQREPGLEQVEASFQQQPGVPEASATKKAGGAKATARQSAA